MPTLILNPTSTNVVSKKKGGKEYTIISISSSHIKIMFALLAEPIAIKMRFSKIQVGEASHKILLFLLY